MGRRGAPVKERMAMPKFWSMLAGLKDEGWKVIEKGGTISLTEPKYDVDNLSPVCAVASKNSGKLFIDDERAHLYLGLSLVCSQRINDAAWDPNLHPRTRRKIERILGIKKPKPI